MADIYISYAKEDYEKVKLLANSLGSMEDNSGSPLKISLEEPVFHIGDNLSEIRFRAIHQADCIIVIWSEDSLKSEWVRKEATLGLEKGNLLPVLFQMVTPPKAFRSLISYDLSHWQGEKEHSWFIRLVKAITDFLEIKEQPNADQAPLQPNNPQKKQKVKKIRLSLPDIDWVEIPAGSFVFGEGETQQTIMLDRFFIACYPITNCQYQCFIDDNGYREERWWLDSVKPKPAEPGWKQANRPRETVNWYEAVAFTRWLSHRLGFAITLPTEQQWEKVARGTDGRVYPWGDEIKSTDANVWDVSAGEDNLKQTCAVGLYLHRQSYYGVADLAGNVWEWCLTKNTSPDQIKPDTSGDNRVLRGGSWRYGPFLARSAFRYGGFPDGRNNFIGFRVVCSSPSSEL